MGIQIGLVVENGLVIKESVLSVFCWIFIY
jgi:hypothetical protein